MTVIRISLAQQSEAVRFAETRQRSLANGQAVRPLRRKAEEEHDLVRLGAAARTLKLFAENENELRAFLKLPAEARQAVLSWAETIAESQVLAKTPPAPDAEATAKAGELLR